MANGHPYPLSSYIGQLVPWLVLMIATATALAQQPPSGQPASLATSATVPEAGKLSANWWDYLALGEAGAQERIEALLGRARQAAAALPPELSEDAAQSLERLRVGLDALPAMLAVKPQPREPVPTPSASYTTSALLELDRKIRSLQAELEERRVALEVSARTVKNGQRQLDAVFAEYLREPEDSPKKVAIGLRLMAQRTQLEVAKAEQRNRLAEKRAIEAELVAYRELKGQALARIVPDPGRSVAYVEGLIEKNRVRNAAQREELLRLEAARMATAANPASTLTQLELADQRILTAVIEDAYQRTRISLYETELDWLALVQGKADRAAITQMLERLALRTAENDRIEADSREWLAAASKTLAFSLRDTELELAPEEARARAELTALSQKAISRIDRLRGYLVDVRLATTVTRELAVARTDWLRRLWLAVLDPAGAFLAKANAVLGTALFRIGDTPVTSYGLLRIALMLLLAVGLSRLVRRLLARFGAREGAQSAAYYTVGRLVHYVVILAAVLIGLSSIGLDFSQLALFAGALSIGIGFGLQSIVNNFVSGLIILFEQSLKVGDVVELDSGVRGIVREISVRSTLISTNDNVDIVVPNSEFISAKLTNYTLREPFHRIHVPFGVAYGTDKELVRRVIIEAARKVPTTLHMPGRDPDVWLVKFGDNSLDFELVVWINPAAATRPGAVKAMYLWEIESALAANGIQIPFPQRDVRLKIEPSDRAALEAAVPTSHQAAPPA